MVTKGQEIEYQVEDSQATKYWSQDRYSDVESAVREILTNGTAAVLLAEEFDIEPEVQVDINSETLTIRDNGIGIPIDDFEEKMVHVGTSDKEDLKNIPGMFGIGNLAGNMLTPEGVGFYLESNARGTDGKIAARFNETSVVIEDSGDFDGILGEDKGTVVQFDLPESVSESKIYNAAKEYSEWLPTTVNISSESYDSVTYPVKTLSDDAEDFFEEDEYIIHDTEHVEILIQTGTYVGSYPSVIYNGIPMGRQNGSDLPACIRSIRIKSEDAIVGQVDGKDVYLPETPTDRERLKSGYEDFTEWLSQERDEQLEEFIGEVGGVEDLADRFNENRFLRAVVSKIPHVFGENEDLVTALTTNVCPWTQEGVSDYKNYKPYELISDDHGTIVVAKTINKKRAAVLKEVEEESLVLDLQRKKSKLTYEQADMFGWDRLTDYPYEVEKALELGVDPNTIQGDEEEQSITLWRGSKNSTKSVERVVESLPEWKHIILFPNHSEPNISEYKDLSGPMVLMATETIETIEDLTEHDNIHDARDIDLDSIDQEYHQKVWVGDLDDIPEIFRHYSQHKYGEPDDPEYISSDESVENILNMDIYRLYVESNIGYLSDNITTYSRQKRYLEIEREFKELGLDEEQCRDLHRSKDWIVEELRDCLEK